MPENPLLVERDAPVGGETGADARPRGDAVVQRRDARIRGLRPGHGAGKRVAQPGDHLKQRQIGAAPPRWLSGVNRRPDGAVAPHFGDWFA